ncbi:cyclophilin-like fold protein [Parasutterella secunda]|uniref:Cyclophilin-like domain-containing protein n=1 Tax=Parasutterella secunda TaxID=626947 RepID=A0ABS2GTJ0_9BURK|nr:cyclophilin-like fold protein [Parasutterella secunda]MBM6928791.1 hypothetical protein [Parasutterella secunda]
MFKHILPIALAMSLAGETMAATIEMVVDDKVYNVELADHAAAQDLMSRLPMTLTFENFGQTERIAYLENALKLGNAPTSTTPVVGDFAYYIPWGNVCVFIKDFRHSSDLVPMGKMSEEATEAVRKSEDRPVTFRAIQK